MRATAVLVVILDHVFHAPQGGFVGVDIFFVISGFLITGLLLREIGRTGRISFLKFYERRAKRILPAAAMVIFATLVASYVLIGRNRETKDIIVDGVFSAFFLGNWRFAEQGVDYFQVGTPPSPLQHFWSLGVEEQFYLVWPWVMLLIVVLATAWMKLSIEKSRQIAAGTIAALSVASFAWGLYETQTNPTLAYFSTFSRAWELGVGALIAFIPKFSATATARRAMAWTGLTGVALSLFVVGGDSPFWPAPLALLPVISAALVILAGTGDQRGYRAPWLIRNTVSTYLGDISYSLYLWHFPVAILLVRLVAENTIGYYTLALGLTFALSILSYHLIEDPARRANWFRWKGNRLRGITRVWIRPITAVIVIGALGAVGLNAVSLLRPAAAQDNGPGVRTVAQLAEDPSTPLQFCRGAGVVADPESCDGHIGGGLLPRLDKLQYDRDIGFRCYIPIGEALDSCHFGAERAGAYRVALAGDSHAADLVAAIRPQAAKLNWSVDTFVGRGCGISEIPDSKDNCATARPEINERLTSGDYDLVISATTRRGAPEYDAVVDIMRQIDASGTDLVVMADPPALDEEAISCATRIGAVEADGCGNDEAAATQWKDDHAEAAEQEGVAIVDVRDFYCDDSFCPAISGNVIVFRDAAGHVTATWLRTLSPYLMSEVVEAAG